MNIKDYEYIVAISKYGSISKAADRLCITQGALTKYLQRVENQLGLPLFNRVGNKFILTSIGYSYVEKGKKIVSIDSELCDEIKIISESGEAAIRLGYPMGQDYFIMEHLLPEFYDKCKHASLKLVENSSEGLQKSVADGEIDVCICYVSQKKLGLNYTRLGDSLFVLAVPPTSDLLKLAVKTNAGEYPVLHDEGWMDEPYIKLAPFTRSGAIAQNYFDEKEKYPYTRLYVENTRSALAAVENKLGNCLISAVPHTDRRVRYLQIPDIKQEKNCVHMVTRKKDYISNNLRILIELTQKVYCE